MINVLGVIPARYHSERFPGKVLQKIGKLSVLESVYQHAKKARTLDKVVVATDSEIIAKEANRFGAEVVFTSSNMNM